MISPVSTSRRTGMLALVALLCRIGSYVNLAAAGDVDAAGCDLRLVDDPAEFEPSAAAPVLMRFSASSSKLSRSGFLAKYGRHPAAVYPRHFFEITRPYRPIRAFVSEQLPSSKRAPGAAAAAAAPPLVLSFQDYRGSEELRADLKRGFSLPAGWEGGSWSLSLGANGSGIPMHSTHGAVAAAVLWGRKRWILAPPGTLERAEEGYWDTGPTHVVPSRWPPDVVPKLRSEGVGVLECTQPEGTVLLVPEWWWHGTYNEGDCLAVNSQLDSVSADRKAPYEARQDLVAEMTRAMQGALPASGLADLNRRAGDAVRTDPLQLLRDVRTVATWWGFFAASDQMLRHLAAQVQRVAVWAHRRLGAGTLAPEQCASLAFNLFPFGGMLSAKPFSSLARKHPARTAVRNLIKLTAAALAKPFADGQYRPHAAVLCSAMRLEAGQENEAKAALEKHVRKADPEMQVIVNYAGGLSQSFQHFWQRWTPQELGEL